MPCAIFGRPSWLTPRWTSCLILACALSLSGCGSWTNRGGGFCDIYSAVPLTPGDIQALSTEAARAILKNELKRRDCPGVVGAGNPGAG